MAFSVNDILTKLVNVFKHDIYIIDWRYCLGGKLTEADTPGTAFCILEPECVERFKDEFPKNNVVFIDDIRKFKTDPDNHLNLKVSDSECSKIISKRDDFVKKLTDIVSWHELSLSEKEADCIFDKGGLVDIKFSEAHTFAISKTLFPLIRKVSSDEVRYNILEDKENRGGSFLILTHEHPMFMFYNFVYYLEIE